METGNKFKESILSIKNYISKRNTVSKRAAIQIRILMVLLSLIISILISAVIIKDSPIKVIVYLFDGAFSRPTKFLFDASVLLGFGIAIIPCFKMKYWNMGANGQVVIASAFIIILMKNLGTWASHSGFNNFILVLLMLLVSILASVIWAVIPGIFKAYFNTNETLFTLMMNYVAVGILNYVNIVLSNGNSSTGQINFITQAGWLVGSNTNLGYIVTILIVIIMSVLVMGYMQLTKHGYEISVVGDSAKTAKYVAMDTKRIIIRTTALSGLITGVMAFLLVTAINHSANNVYAQTSFNGILVSWLANFNPVNMGLISMLFSFLNNGMSKVTSSGGLGSSDLVYFVFGLIFFSILVSEFMLRYKVDYRKLEMKWKYRKEKLNKKKEGVAK